MKKNTLFSLIAVHISPMKFLSCIFLSLSLLIIAPISAAGNNVCDSDDHLYCPRSDRGYSWKYKYKNGVATIRVIGLRTIGVRAAGWSKDLVLPARFNIGGTTTGINGASNWDFDIRAPDGEWINFKILEVHHSYNPYGSINAPSIWDVVTVTGKFGSQTYEHIIR